MIILKTKEQIEQISHNGKILRDAVNLAQDKTRPGITTAEIDKTIEEHIRKNGATPTFLGYGANPHRRGFPAASCISINDVLVHGIPGKLRIKEGDLVSIDIGVTKGGCVADSCYSYIVGKGNRSSERLLKAAKDITMYGISLVKAGVRIHDLAVAIDFKAKEYGYITVAGLHGHGTGQNLHEKPTIPFTKPPYLEVIPNIKLEENMVITIEPVVTMPSNDGKYIEDKDGWTLRTIDGSWSAQFEHTILVRSSGVEILTGTFRER